MKRSTAQKRQIQTHAMIYTDIVWAPPLGWKARWQLRQANFKGQFATVYLRTQKGWIVGGRVIEDNPDAVVYPKSRL